MPSFKLIVDFSTVTSGLPLAEYSITRGFLYFNYHVVWGESHPILFYALEVYFRNI